MKGLRCFFPSPPGARECDGAEKFIDVRITLLERLLFELKYFRESGKHLDIKNITLCSASRNTDGGVPGVDFYGSEVRVGKCNPGYAHADLRAREVVS